MALSKSLANGYILHEDEARIIIATGFTSPSRNRKTGPMIQIWILVKAVSPVEAVNTGFDSIICGDCPHRTRLVESITKRGKVVVRRVRPCYVNVGQAPQQVWKAWKRGAYPALPDVALFAGRAVRFGAYGDPVHLPIEKVRAIAAQASRWTGYTHQWEAPGMGQYRPFFMASADSALDLMAAQAMGWRTFRVRTSVQPLVSGEIACPAAPEGGSKVQCAKCGLCAGTSRAGAASIAIVVHGAGKGGFVALTALSMQK